MANFKGITLPDGTTYFPEGSGSAIDTVSVSVDNNTGIPSATGSVSGTTLNLDFKNLKGETGSTGPKGDPGQGIPAGGTTGQVLKKKSGKDYDTEWADETGGSSTTGGVESFLIKVPENVSTVELFSGKSYKNVEIYSIAKLTTQAVLILYINGFYSEIGTVPTTYFGGGYFCRSAVGSNGSVVTKFGFGSTFSCLNDSKYMDSINTANVTLSDEGNEIVAGSAFLVIGYN